MKLNQNLQQEHNLRTAGSIHGSKDLAIARTMGILTYSLIGLIYLIIFLIGWLASGTHNQYEEGYQTKWEVVRDIILVVFGANNDLGIKPILVAGHLGMIVLLNCHIPFIYFIGKEHILSSIDEVMNRSLSQMVDRVKNKFKGDPRHFLVQKTFVIRDRLSNSVLLEE